MVSQLMQQTIKSGRKLFALLIDPDKHTHESLIQTINVANKIPGPDLILVGGSLLFNHISDTLKCIKEHTNLPVVLFPGNALQVAPEADALLLLSLISGRNPDFLIGQHVLAAPAIKRANIEIIPTGYMLIGSGTETSVQYMSNTMPIPRHKPDIAVATAMAGQMLGLQAIYLEAGSGAAQPVPTQIIKAVKNELQIPLIVGGGLSSPELAKQALANGADIIVVGTAIEKNPELITLIAGILVKG